MTTQYRQSQQRRALEANLLGLGVAMMLAAPAFLAAPSPATAVPITYDLSPSVMSVVPGGTDTVTGTFTFDQNGSPFGATLDAVDLTVTGPLHPGTYDTPLGTPPLFPPDSFGVTTGTPGGPAFELMFANPLGNTSDKVTAFNFSAPTIIDTTPTQGTAVPRETAVPEPATWAMMLFGFGVLGLASCWSRRRSVSIAA